MPAGKRPVLVLSMDKAIGVRESVTVAQVTQTIRNIPTEVRLGLSDGLPKQCVVNTDVVLTLPKTAFIARICSLSARKLSAVSDAVKFAMDL